MEIEFERAALFREIWASPISTLAKKYGLSDNGLRQICISLAIPLPGRGHWAKVAAGHKIPTPELLETQGRTRFHLRALEPCPAAPAASESWLEQRLAFEADPANAIEVPLELMQTHKLVAATARAFDVMRRGLEKSLDRTINPPPRVVRGVPVPPTRNPPPYWSEYVRKGHVPDLPVDVLPMRISLDAGDRALRIWDALVKACVARGMTVAAAGGRLIVGILGKCIELRMTERIKTLTGPTKGMSKLAIEEQRHVTRVPTGVLRVVVDSRYREVHFDDRPGKPLESQLNAVLQQIHRRIAEQVEQSAHAVEARRPNEIVEQGRAAWRQEQEEGARRAAQAKLLEDQLVVEVNAWRQAETIRAYIAHLASSIAASGAPAGPELHAWLDWAAAVANRLDPAPRRLASEPPISKDVPE
jgi:hypothetical protein